jgi:hypothetical protein
MDCPVCDKRMRRGACPIHGHVRIPTATSSAESTASAVGISDHGSLSGLTHDDHTRYWDGAAGRTMTVSDTEPSSPQVGDIWIDIG